METQVAGEVTGDGGWRLNPNNHPRLRRTLKTPINKMEVDDVHIETSALETADTRLSGPPAEQLDDHHQETFLSILYQVVVPLLISGLAMVGAGLYFDSVQHWVVFKAAPEIIILVPGLLGLKGNLEMTLASRLSTEANLGRMADPNEQWIMIIGNLALVQCQAIVVGLLSSIVAVILAIVFYDQKTTTQNALMLCACSITTASIASFLLGILTVAIIMSSVYLKLNPDNVTTPIAASLGDITSLVIFTYIASTLHKSLNDHLWVCVCIIMFFIILMPIWIYIAKNNNYTNNVLTTGWGPILAAMFISTIGGLLLSKFVKKYKDLSAYQPVINGVGGNLVSIQASRLATALHKSNLPLGELPENFPIFIPPIKAFTSKGVHALTSRVLLFLAVPGHFAFVIIIVYLKTGSFKINLIFTPLYMFAAILQVSILLYSAFIITHLFWKRGVNPDSTTIPYLTSLGDLIGIIFLGLVFVMMEYLDPEDLH